jgi:hypothetical protein
MRVPGLLIVRGLAVLALADPRSVSDDPKVARPRLKTIHCQGHGIGGRSGRPAVAHTVDLAASLEVAQAGESLVFVQASGSRDHRGRKRAGHLARRALHAIPTRLGLTPLSLRVRRQDRVHIGVSGFGCGQTSHRRIVAESTRQLPHSTTGSRPGGRTTSNRRRPRPERQTLQRRPARPISIKSSSFIGSRRSSQEAAPEPTAVPRRRHAGTQPLWPGDDGLGSCLMRLQTAEVPGAVTMRADTPS